MVKLVRNFGDGPASGAVLLGALLGLAVLVPGGGSGGTEGPASTGEQEIRTVVVLSGQGEPRPSQPGQPLRVQLNDGLKPVAEMAGTVLTDENCAPDERGISHCLNKIRLADGQELEVVHSHDMGEVPCLAPDEEVRVRAA
ncbi:MAG TPA: hypothetical protein VFD37_01110 [Solirubrobacterales bacterium]|nr:hypothetical protein [Solirubrobacterales bacterium]